MDFFLQAYQVESDFCIWFQNYSSLLNPNHNLIIPSACRETKSWGQIDYGLSVEMRTGDRYQRYTEFFLKDIEIQLLFNISQDLSTMASVQI